MRFRTKLLIILLVISIGPMLFLRLSGVKHLERLLNEIGPQARKELLESHTQRLLLLVESFSSITELGGHQIEMGTVSLAREASRLLARPDSFDAQPLLDAGLKLFRPKKTERETEYQRETSMGQVRTFRLDYDRTAVAKAMGAGKIRGTDLARVQALERLTGFSRTMDNWVGKFTLWQLVCLNNGLFSLYPALDHVPRMADPRKDPWFQLALEQKALTWSTSFVDPFTRRVVVACTVPVVGPDKELMGAAALIVPISEVVGQHDLVQNLPAGTEAILAYVEDAKEDKVLVVATPELEKEKPMMHWRAPLKTRYLKSQDKIEFDAMIKDINVRMSNARRMEYEGKDCLWVYGPVGEDTFLVCITPYASILAPIEQVEERYMEEISSFVTTMGAAGLAVLVVVVILAFIFSRTVTRPLAALAEGGQRLGEGDFDVQVAVKSKDELGQLGKVFNTLGPKLKEHSRMRQSLDLAMEVQQRLLPTVEPDIQGLEITGQSLYCDETGGDYFDYMDAHGQGAEGVALVVGDVSGHGIPAALMMTSARAFLRQRTSMPGTLAEVVSDVNRQLAKDVYTTGRFMTLFFCEIDGPNNQVRWVRAGHDPAIVYDPATGKFDELKGDGLALGVSEDYQYIEYSRPTMPGELIFIGTDGIWETKNQDDEMFGKDRLRTLIKEYANAPTRKIVSVILEALKEFRGALDQDDDVTFVVVRVEK